MSDLQALVASELDRPAPAAASALADAIRARHGDAVASVVFYGSCLRKNTPEGVLDFYVLVDGYRSALGSRWQSALGAALPPNVYYLEAECPSGTVRCKYAVISSDDFARCVSASATHPYIWARFSQPALIAWARNDAARDHVVECAARAVITFVQRLVVFLPARGRVQRFSFAALWQSSLQRTYGTEFRSEQPESIRGLYEADAERYDRAAALALDVLVEEKWLDAARQRPNAVEVEMPPMRRRLACWRWKLLRPVCKVQVFFRLIKTAFTFGDWVPYVLWKVERHSGIHIEPTERQRKHPLIYGWPVVVKLLRSGALR